MNLFGDEQPPPQSAALAASPELETSGGISPPRSAQEVLSHDVVEQRLLGFINADCMPHGLVFNGPKGIGKSTMAYRLVKALLARGIIDPNQNALFTEEEGASLTTLATDSNHPQVRLVTSGAHPDFMSVERTYDEAKNRYKSNVDVKEVRKIAPFMRMTASEGGWRIVLIDDADTMNRNAQNAILKVLEEPPNNVLLILITHRLGALIPTIRSRVQIMNFQPLGNTVFQKILDNHPETIDEKSRTLLEHFSGGSIGKALEYLEEGALETFQNTIELIAQYPNWNWKSIHKAADSFSRAGQEKNFVIFSEVCIGLLYDLCQAKACGTDIESPLFAAENAIQSLYNSMSLSQLIETHDHLQVLFKKTERANLDKRQAVLRAFFLIG